MKETNAIFENLQKVHREAAFSETTLRLSLDAKAPVLIGPFSRGGQSRIGKKGSDHDFGATGKFTPFGIFLPDYKDLSLYFAASKVTSDFMVDRLDQWWQQKRFLYPKVDTLLLDLDNGPENHSRRSQFIYRMVLFAQATHLTIVLVYYPPYHVSQAYNKGVVRSTKEMKLLEKRLVRLEGLPKWFVTIVPPKPDEIILPA